MLAPKRIKFRKQFKGRTKGIATRGNTVAFGEFGLTCLEPGWITNRQIEASRVAMTREVAETAMALAAAKLSVKSKFVVREEAHTDAG